MIWPMHFPAQPCHRCHRFIDADDDIEIVFDDSRKPVVWIGVQHKHCLRQPVEVK